LLTEIQRSGFNTLPRGISCRPLKSIRPDTLCRDPTARDSLRKGPSDYLLFIIGFPKIIILENNMQALPAPSAQFVIMQRGYDKPKQTYMVSTGLCRGAWV